MTKLLQLDADNKELLHNYKLEAFELLSQIDDLKDQLKLVIDTAASGVGLKKAYVGKYFKSRYAGKTQDIINEAQILEFLKEGEDTDE
jgi:hypothetical protein